MRLGSWQFSPKLWAVLLYVAVLSCMLWLGGWQLDRAALKVSLQEAAQEAQDSDPVPLSSITALDEAAAVYQRVSLEGQYDANRQFLWDNRTHSGRAGFEVISLVKIAGGEWVMVNRGWIAPGASRQALPDVTLVDTALHTEVFIQGFASQPSQGFASGPALGSNDSWPKLLQYFDYELIEAIVGEPVLPVVVQAQALGTDAVSVNVPGPRPEWLTANWQPAASGPAKHYSYAFQWYAMALALSLLFLVVNTRRVGSTPDEPTTGQPPRENMKQ